MKYIIPFDEAKKIGITPAGKAETVEISDDGLRVQYRLLTPWTDISREVLDVWKASRGMECKRCEHRWISILTTGTPLRCPACNSPYWNRPRRSQPVVHITPMILDWDGKFFRCEWVCEPCQIAWLKDVNTANVVCPQCRRKCGATSRRVEILAEDAVTQGQPGVQQVVVLREEDSDAG